MFTQLQFLNGNVTKNLITVVIALEVLILVVEASCSLFAELGWTFKIKKGGRSASKFRKSQVRKFADLIFLDSRTFRKCGNLRICVCGPNYFCGLKTSAYSQMHSFKFKDDFWLLEQFWDSVTWHFVEEANPSGSGSESLLFIFNLWICDLGTETSRKFADLRFTGSSLQIWGFAIGRSGAPQKFADLWLRNKPKNVRIFEITKSKRVPTFAQYCKKTKTVGLEINPAVFCGVRRMFSQQRLRKVASL